MRDLTSQEELSTDETKKLPDSLKTCDTSQKAKTIDESLSLPRISCTS